MSNKRHEVIRFMNMSNGAKIKEARIDGLTTTPCTASAASMFNEMPRVMYKMEGASDTSPFEELFSYYPDEIQFSADEFVGLTLGEARQLFRDRDIAYLQS